MNFYRYLKYIIDCVRECVILDYSQWKELKLSVSEILLDPENPRVFVDEPTQENLLRFLIEEESSIELAKQIHFNKGLPPADKPVITKEDGKYIVLEGNRRVAACKILLNPLLLPPKDAEKIPRIDNHMRNYLENFPVTLAPNRNSAEAYITMRHSGEKGIKRWSTISVAKRFFNRYKKGEKINDIAKILDEKPSDVKRGIRFYNFLQFIINELDWTENEKKELVIHKLETTILDRFLPFSKRAKEVLKIDFTSDHMVISQLPEEKFKAALKNIVRRAYIEKVINTRSKTDDVFNDEILRICTSKDHYEDVNREKQKPRISEIEEEKNVLTIIHKNDQDVIGIDLSSEEGHSSIQVKDGKNDVHNNNNKGVQIKKSATDINKYLYLTKAYPFTNKYKNNNRINTLIKEIKNIKYKEYRMASMYLIRSLLETYTHEYIDYFIKDRNKPMKGVSRERKNREDKLKDLLYSNIKNHLKEYFLKYKEEIGLLDITFTDNNNTAITRIINYYIHAQSQIPDIQEILDAWKKVSKIIYCLDEILAEHTK